MREDADTAKHIFLAKMSLWEDADMAKNRVRVCVCVFSCSFRCCLLFRETIFLTKR